MCGIYYNEFFCDDCRTPEKKAESRRRLPKLVYELMKDGELRRKCTETKLSTQGDKKTLVKRHKRLVCRSFCISSILFLCQNYYDVRYTLLYNAECDSINPRPVSEIVKQVEREEREEAKANSKVFKVIVASV